MQSLIHLLFFIVMVYILVMASIKLKEFGLGFLSSDPIELSSIDGLDDPLERLRLRDSDTGSILDMIQLITQRYILRPQNLPAVKINFDSFSIFFD